MQKIVEPYHRLINYYETDKMGVVHHSNYIRYFEEARLYYMNKVGLPYDKLEAMGIIIPVLSVNCDYRKFVKYGDQVDIHTKITDFDGVVMTIKYELYNGDTLCATGVTSHCFLDNNFKVIRLNRYNPEVYKQLLQYLQK